MASSKQDLSELYDLDVLFIHSLLAWDNKDDVKEAIEKTPLNLVSGEERLLYKFILDYYKLSKGALPTEKILKERFELDNVPSYILGSPLFRADELKNRRKYEAYTEASSSIRNALLEKDIEKADKALLELTKNLAEEKRVETVTMYGGLKQRLEKYEAHKKLKGLIGYITKIKALDSRIGGFTNEMTVISGKAGLGKTYTLLKILSVLWWQVERPILIISNEMPCEKLAGRMDAISANISYSNYRKGLCTEEEEERLYALVNDYSYRENVIIENGAGLSVQDVEMLVIKHNPCVLAVDGLYLTDMGFKEESDNTRAASRGYQRLTRKYLIPTFFTTQENDDGTTKYARAIKEDADILLSLFRSTAMRDDDVMGLQFFKLRDDNPDIKIYLDWNFDNLNFKEVDYGVPDKKKEVVVD